MEVLLQGPDLLSFVRNFWSSSQSPFCTLCIHTARRDDDVKNTKPSQRKWGDLALNVKISS